MKKTTGNFTEMEKCIKLCGTYILYGAGVVAYSIYTAIQELYHCEPEYVVVSGNEAETNFPCHVKVSLYSKLPDEKWKLPVVAAVPEIYHEQIRKLLSRRATNLVFYVDTHLEYCVMSRFFRKTNALALLEDLHGTKDVDEDISDKFHVFMAVSHCDKTLSHHYKLPEYICRVQAGSDCTTVDLHIEKDNTGENISFKNKNYCELTVMYWAWKNKKSAYKGLAHYRRMLLLNREELQCIVDNDIDVVLPLPFVCYPNAAGQYQRYISAWDCQNLKKVLALVAPEYLEVWDVIDHQPIFYNYNMLIAKETVFDEYSSWLFGVLEYAEKFCEKSGEPRRDRYAGYLAELLFTLYFEKNKNRLKIVHAKKLWMV